MLWILDWSCQTNCSAKGNGIIIPPLKMADHRYLPVSGTLCVKICASSTCKYFTPNHWNTSVELHLTQIPAMGIWPQSSWQPSSIPDGNEGTAGSGSATCGISEDFQMAREAREGAHRDSEGELCRAPSTAWESFLPRRMTKNSYQEWQAISWIWGGFFGGKHTGWAVLFPP